MDSISIKNLLDAGVHFGHRATNWNPKMKKYIFAKKKGLHIIDLQKTLQIVEKALNYVQNVATNGGKILFVGTKRQAQESIKTQAERANQLYINHRWIGGLLTNFKTVKRSIKQLNDYEALLESEEKRQSYTKRELSRISKKLHKMQESLNGIKNMKVLPDLIFVVDSAYEQNAISEANKMQIPIIALIDTNANPDLVDIAIPGNDDAIRSISLFVEHIAEAIIKGTTISLKDQLSTDEENALINEIKKADATTSDSNAASTTAHKAPTTSPAVAKTTTSKTTSDSKNQEKESKVQDKQTTTASDKKVKQADNSKDVKDKEEKPKTEKQSVKVEETSTKKNTTEQKVADKKVADKKVAEQKVADKKVAEQKVADKKVAEQKVAEQKVAEQKVADKKVADKKVAEQKVAEQKVAEQKVADKKVADKKVAEQKAEK